MKRKFYYMLSKFNTLYKLILENFGFDSLNSNDFPKAIKYHNLIENDDIEIKNQIILPDYLNEIQSIILSKHCIKSETENNIHGINYLNIPLSRFYNQYIVKSLIKIITNSEENNIPINTEEIYFNIRIQDTYLKQDFCFIIKSIPIQYSYNLNIILITIFPKQYEQQILKKIIKYDDHGNKIINRNIQLILNENKQQIKVITFDLILDH